MFIVNKYQTIERNYSCAFNESIEKRERAILSSIHGAMAIVPRDMSLVFLRIISMSKRVNAQQFVHEQIKTTENI
jgi:hypothetical protein